MWEPDSDLQRVIKLQLDARRQHWTRWYRQSRKEIAERLGAQGMSRSGAFLSEIFKAAERATLTIAREQLSDILETLSEVYGQTPPESFDWISQQVNGRIDLSVIEFGSDVDRAYDSMQIPTRAQSDLQDSSYTVRREIEIKLGKLDARARLRQLTPPPRPVGFQADVFISYASEDVAVAEAIAGALTEHGRTVWLDKAVLRLGDRLLEKIDDGLAGCRFGVVVLSPSFFAKQWPRRELAGLAAREDAEDRKVILPVWHGVTHQDIASFSPTLAAALGVSTDRGIPAIVAEIEAVLNH